MPSAEARETEEFDKKKHACSLEEMNPTFIVEGDPLACVTLQLRTVILQSRMVISCRPGSQFMSSAEAREAEESDKASVFVQLCVEGI